MMRSEGRRQSKRLLELEKQKKKKLNEGRKADGTKDHHRNAAPKPSKNSSPFWSKLRMLLGILKRRDSDSIFLKPVDPEEVENYYDVIKEPMDFGTITAKLNAGSYKILEEFERDVTLVWSNAMHFNDSSTPFYKRARAIRDLAKKLFASLKTDPENFVALLQAESVGGRKSKYSELYRRRDTYWTLNPLLNETASIASTFSLSRKELVRNKVNSIGYAESLMQFAKDLGPTANAVARQKLQTNAEAAINLRGGLRKDTAYSDFPTTWEAPCNTWQSSEQAMPDLDIGNTYSTNPSSQSPDVFTTSNTKWKLGGTQATPDIDSRFDFLKELLGDESSARDTSTDLGGKSVQKMPDQNMGESQFTSPQFGKSTNFNISGKSVWGSSFISNAASSSSSTRLSKFMSGSTTSAGPSQQWQDIGPSTSNMKPIQLPDIGPSTSTSTSNLKPIRLSDIDAWFR